jgi:3D-(3,5/4)-trihydroxycyclohexane-1,2-dione acylhydrolase (decyclizing)
MASATNTKTSVQQKIGKQTGTVRLTTGQAIVQFLKNQYSERDGRRQRLIPAIFGILGHGNVAGLGQALHEYGDGLPFFQPCNEQGMVHTAIGFAKAMGRVSTLACTSSIGPGSTNMITGAATATVNRLPVLLFPSDYYATRHQGTVLQQLEHPVSADCSVNDCFRPVSRFFDRIIRPEQLLTALPRAMRVLMDPADTGAVTLSLPEDIQSHAYDFPVHFFEERAWKIERRIPDPADIRKAAELLKQARRPMIIAGGGVIYSGAREILQQFAEQFGIAVAETSAGKGAMANPSNLLLGGMGLDGSAAAAKIAAQADLILVIGSRLTDFTTGSQSCFQNPDVKFIGINVCAWDAYKEGSLPIVADAKMALEALTAAAREASVRADAAYVAEVGNAKNQWIRTLQEEGFRPVPGEAMGQGELVGILNRVAQPGDTVVAAAGSAPGDVLRAWDATGGKNAHLEFGFSCMGYEIPAGLGVRMAQPEGEVYVFVGDGTYLMNPTELLTAVREELKITIVISENHGYQVIRKLQMLRAGAHFGTEFRRRVPETKRLDGEYISVDLAQNGASLGARSWHARTPEEFEKALGEARAERNSCVIVVETEPHRYVPGSGVWWDVAPAEITNDPVVKELRDQYERDRKKLQRFHF